MTASQDTPSPSPSRSPGRRPSGAGPARLIAPFALAGLAVALIMATVAVIRPAAHRESDVIRHIHEQALREPYGWIGPWRITADSIDPATGEMVDFTLEAETLHLTAERAAVRIDADANTFSLELWEVHFVPVPEAEGQSMDGALTYREHHVLGPIEYNRRIAPDVHGPPDAPEPVEPPLPDDIARGESE